MSATAEARIEPSQGAHPPFPGLRPFSLTDHKYFFGRETQKYALYLLLKRNHFVSVVGSSGCGKSSIVRAGLLPILDDENGRGGSDAWRYITLRPGHDPIERLARALAGISMREANTLFAARRDRIAAILRASREGISEVLSDAANEFRGQFVIVIDQFEELFRYLSAGAQTDRIAISKRREEATNFVQLLLAATQRFDSPIRVVVTMRSDFIGDCATFQELPEAVSAAQFLVPSLTRDQREETIRNPIELSGATIAPELVERLLNDSTDEIDQLPVLQHCLARLWMRAGPIATIEPRSDPPCANSPPSGRHLTEQDYQDIGGLAGALSGHADEILGSLLGKEELVEKIFRALTEIDKDGRAIRRPRSLERLIAETGENKVDVCAALDKFRADDCSFLVPPLSSGVSEVLRDETIIDVGHEALLRRWKHVSGDPEATGERGDKRDIGWLRHEQRDGERYQFLRSCVDPESANGTRLSDDQVKRYWGWWNRRKPNPTWAIRYGGKFEEVSRLLLDSEEASRKSLWQKYVSYVTASIVAAVFVAGSLAYLEQRRQAVNTFRFAVKAAETFSKQILETFNVGQLTTTGAVELQKVADQIYKTVEVNDNSQTSAMRTRWLLTTFDLGEALGEPRERMRSYLNLAETNARKYLERDRGNTEWRNLLYGSLFRAGDLDLDQAKYEQKPRLGDRAVAEYEESQNIADQLLKEASAQQLALPDLNQLADLRFDLAFAINKVGEAMQAQGKIEGALKRYVDALELASLVEDSPRMDCRLQSATTRIKIAGALLALMPPDPTNALSNSSDAIAREEAILATDQTNNIVRSNLAAAHEVRAQAFELSGKLESAFSDYAEALDILESLAKQHSVDIKWLSRLARAHQRFGSALERYAREGNRPLDRAIEQYRSEVTSREQLAERHPNNAMWQQNLQEARQRLNNLATPNVPPSAKSTMNE